MEESLDIAHLLYIKEREVHVYASNRKRDVTTGKMKENKWKYVQKEYNCLKSQKHTRPRWDMESGTECGRIRRGRRKIYFASNGESYNMLLIFEHWNSEGRVIVK